MATQRKPATTKAAKKFARPAKVARKPVPAKSSAKPFVAKPPAKPPAAKSKAKTPPKLPKGALLAIEAAKKRAAAKKMKMPKPPAPVHPLGVLPPESVARGTGRPPKPIPIPVRPKTERTPGAAAGKPITAKDYQEFEQRLRDERARVMKEMGHYESTVLKVNPRDSAGDLSGYSFHMADVGTDSMEREKAFQLASAEGRILLEINEALRRMARGEYGVCESCGNPILRARLEAMPTARLCLSCKEKEERAARGIS
ncbi:MAG: TraR/DksA C4-type zinc finger protein [Candidatus Eisenbacteria bacterium]|uniref:TraR/DksA C4-type zinc finger protein n=1 Tax=Eiseniibacteriota bacterium TaxID=2212470 RepID=A0A9D6L586_UNCEI|nr:TraR/DksA C4-type zinc finger protein [Candidatus Eisenbacteria bacterium]MBI3539021.1 TraR/DksA C4-type zinc finger protein [Candidatus Eisenbacteria bacterium]